MNIVHVIIIQNATYMYSGTSLIRTLLGQKKVSWLKRCPYFRGWNVYKCSTWRGKMCPVQRGVLNSGCPVSLYMLILCNGIAGSLVYQYYTYAARVPVGGASSAGEDERGCSGKWTEANGTAESREAAEGAASRSEFMCLNIDIHMHLLHHSYM